MQILSSDPAIHDGESKILQGRKNVGVPKKNMEMIITWHILEDKKKWTQFEKRQELWWNCITLQELTRSQNMSKYDNSTARLK